MQRVVCTRAVFIVAVAAFVVAVVMSPSRLFLLTVDLLLSPFLPSPLPSFVIIIIASFCLPFRPTAVIPDFQADHYSFFF